MRTAEGRDTATDSVAHGTAPPGPNLRSVRGVSSGDPKA